MADVRIVGHVFGPQDTREYMTLLDAKDARLPFRERGGGETRCAGRVIEANSASPEALYSGAARTRTARNLRSACTTLYVPLG